MQLSKHILNLLQDNTSIELPGLPSLLTHLLMCFALVIDQNFNNIAPKINLAQFLMKYCRYLKTFEQNLAPVSLQQ